MDASGVLGKSFDGNEGSSVSFVCVGQALREARLRAGLELKDISSELKIGITFLQAIEDMDISALPPKAYASGFVRCYATLLGCNAQTMVDHFDAENCSKTVTHRDLSLRSTPFLLDFTLPKGAGFAIALVGILGLATWFGNRTDVASHMVPPVPELLRSWSQSDALQNVPDMDTKAIVQVKIEP